MKRFAAGAILRWIPRTTFGVWCAMCVLLGTGTLPFILGAQTRGDAPPDTAVYAVSYLDVRPASRTAAVAAFRQYRDASRKDGGYARFELFEQPDRPGHYFILERWTDAKAFDAHAAAPQVKQFMDALQPIRLSGYDQRPYKTLTVTPTAAPAAGQAIHVVTHVDTVPALEGDPPGNLRRLADASRAEPGNLRFDILQHTMRPNHFTLVETWQNQKALEAHNAAAHTRQFRDWLQVIAGGPLDQRLFKSVE